MSNSPQHKVIVGISGASGSVYGVALLEALREVEHVESHLVVSASGYLTVSTETGIKKSQLEALADVVHDDRNVGASIASGSFPSLAMIIAPCSMKTLGCVAQGIGSSLMTRSADVMLKERRRLILLARETPLNLAHIRNMAAVTEMGGIVYPPVPAFYSNPPDIDTMVRETVGRVMSLAGVQNTLYSPWQGLGSA
ncbi:MAG: UbiX family flavin prenyltransferase [Pseudomonadota bacterium]